MIEHEGVIVHSTNKRATVKILNQSACASCHLKGKCNLSDTKEKYIEVVNRGVNYDKGDRVIITGAESIGFKALFLGYILPFILVLTTVVLFTFLNFSELTAGLAGLVTLIPYYTGLKFVNHKLEKQFSFYLKNT